MFLMNVSTVAGAHRIFCRNTSNLGHQFLLPHNVYKHSGWRRLGCQPSTFRKLTSLTTVSQPSPQHRFQCSGAIHKKDICLNISYWKVKYKSLFMLMEHRGDKSSLAGYIAHLDREGTPWSTFKGMRVWQEKY